MTQLFKLQLEDGSTRLAVGDGGPERLLERPVDLDCLLTDSASLRRWVSDADTGQAPPDGYTIVAPVGSQEVWAAGVTYLTSRDARQEESSDGGDVYVRVYDATRPELFFKAPGWRVSGPGAEIAVRADSAWNVPEPELTLVLARDGQIAGYTIGNDVSSRSIEGENPLYLPQAKVYDRSCAIGPCVTLADVHERPVFEITISIERDGETVFSDSTTTAQLTRTFEELSRYLFRALTFPHGAFLMTGTCLVPPSDTTLLPGDEVAVTIPGIGVLRNAVCEVGGS
jgi:2-dehydro-3-deoxy-D-arabinonate dehydratase